MIEAAKNVGIQKLLLMRYLDMQVLGSALVHMPYFGVAMWLTQNYFAVWMC
jgi:hypothetical protein